MRIAACLTLALPFCGCSLALSTGDFSGGAEVDEGDVAAQPPREGDAATDADASFGDDADASSGCTPVSVGPRYPASASGSDWVDPRGIRAPDNDVAHSAGTRQPITVRDFGFSLPQSATVLGIEVAIARTTVGNVSDVGVSLPRGTSKSNGPWPQGDPDGPFVTAKYGGPNDTWGATWSAAELNSTDFFVKLEVSGSGDGHADSLGVTVTYCP